MGELEYIMTGRSKKWMRLVEQSVLLLSQANMLMNHNRRLNILTRFLKESKTETHLLKENGKPLMGLSVCAICIAQLVGYLPRYLVIVDSDSLHIFMKANCPL